VTEKPKYHDVRSEFWKRHFDLALDYDGYLAASEESRAQRWRNMDAQIPAPTPEQTVRLYDHNRTMHVLVYSGVWCGDCVRQGPMLRRIAEACGDRVELRFIDRDASEALQDELRVLGALRVPMAVFLSEDFFEIGRFGDRLLTAYRAKACRELGPACDAGILPPPPEELIAEIEEWVKVFERMLLMLRLSPMLRARHGD
jgi:hypothetical protein